MFIFLLFVAVIAACTATRFIGRTPSSVDGILAGTQRIIDQLEEHAHRSVDAAEAAQAAILLHAKRSEEAEDEAERAIEVKKRFEALVA